MALDPPSHADTLVPGSPCELESPGSSIFDFPVHGYTVGRSDKLTSSKNLHRTGQSHLRSTQEASLEGHSFIILSGGTGCNSICSAFGDACYVLPVSDDGGSSSEIIRVLGGPSIGDIRSRLVRLIPPAPSGSSLDRIRNLLAYRLGTESTEREVREEWRDIVEGRSYLWSGIPSDRKEVIRGFLVYFENEVLRRAHKSFSFRNGSIGNYFLAAAQSFFRSLPSAIFLFSSITGSQANIVPVLVTNHTVTIAVELENGSSLVGQCNISHPMGWKRLAKSRISSLQNHPRTGDDGNMVAAGLFYINAYGHEIKPPPNPDFITNLSVRDVLVYSCGSLWTSIIPCLALEGVAYAIARSRTIKAKVLLLNSQNDRETYGYGAVDYVNAITRTLNARVTTGLCHQALPNSAFITHLVHLKGGIVTIDADELLTMGIQCIEVEAKDGKHGNNRVPLFDTDSIHRALRLILEGLEDGR